MARRLLLFYAIMLTVVFSNAHAAGVEIAVGAWQRAISGTLSYKPTSDLDDIDLDNEMEFDDESGVFGRIKFDMPLFFPNIYLVGAPMEFEGAGTNPGSLKFGDTRFDYSAGLTSKIALNQYDVGFYYGLPFVKTGTMGMLNIDVGLNIRIVDLDVSVIGRDADTGFTTQAGESITVPVPMLYVGVQFIPFESLAFEAEGRGLALGDNTLYSILGRVRYNFAGPVFLAGGYRYDKLEIDEDDVVADMDFRGPFIELGLKF